MILIVWACISGTPDSADSVPDEAVDCEECLNLGGTWQPEAGGCTEDCAFQDVSCFTDTCPDACSVESCDSCFSEEDCTSAGCTWEQEAEAMWCTEG